MQPISEILRKVLRFQQRWSEGKRNSKFILSPELYQGHYIRKLSTDYPDATLFYFPSTERGGKREVPTDYVAIPLL